MDVKSAYLQPEIKKNYTMSNQWVLKNSAAPAKNLYEYWTSQSTAKVELL